MKQQITILDIVEYLLQEYHTTSSPGLYNGKAGLSLSLFVASGYLKDEKIEEIAFNLIKESLIRNKVEFGFEDGLTGIGYALLYLIENQYLETNFDEIFGEQYEAIIKSFDKIEDQPIRLINSLKAVYFFSEAGRIKKDDDRAQLIIKKIFEGVEFFLTIQFHDFDDINYISKKISIINTYTLYLKLINYVGYANFSHSLLDDYASLYRRGKILSSFEIGFFLKTITEKHRIKGDNDVINENISNGIRNTYPYTLSLKEQIDLARLTNNNKNMRKNDCNMVPEFEIIRKNDTIQDILEFVDEKSNPLGYGAGLARLLISFINKNIELL